MKERPILFSAPMVRALLNGTKTQTRRVVKFSDRLGRWDAQGFHQVQPDAIIKAPWTERAIRWNIACSHGQPGDRLWVRESFSPYEHREGCWYWADGRIAAHDCTKPKPSIHMPRWASRITLEITGVRADRLQDISEADAQAEGVYTDPSCPAYEAYEALWEVINGAGSWASNPWVWVIEFKKVTA